ncbi:MAG: hypothetical protein C4289_01815, partial [Chloroflexota bacterium]
MVDRADWVAPEGPPECFCLRLHGLRSDDVRVLHTLTEVVVQRDLVPVGANRFSVFPREPEGTNAFWRDTRHRVDMVGPSCSQKVRGASLQAIGGRLVVATPEEERVGERIMLAACPAAWWEGRDERVRPAGQQALEHEEQLIGVCHLDGVMADQDHIAGAEVAVAVVVGGGG